MVDGIWNPAVFISEDNMNSGNAIINEMLSYGQLPRIDYDEGSELSFITSKLSYLEMVDLQRLWAGFMDAAIPELKLLYMYNMAPAEIERMASQFKYLERRDILSSLNITVYDNEYRKDVSLLDFLDEFENEIIAINFENNYFYETDMHSLLTERLMNNQWESLGTFNLRDSKYIDNSILEYLTGDSFFNRLPFQAMYDSSLLLGHISTMNMGVFLSPSTIIDPDISDGMQFLHSNFGKIGSRTYTKPLYNYDINNFRSQILSFLKSINSRVPNRLTNTLFMLSKLRIYDESSSVLFDMMFSSFTRI